MPIFHRRSASARACDLRKIIADLLGEAGARTVSQVCKRGGARGVAPARARDCPRVASYHPISAAVPEGRIPIHLHERARGGSGGPGSHRSRAAPRSRPSSSCTTVRTSGILMPQLLREAPPRPTPRSVVGRRKRGGGHRPSKRRGEGSPPRGKRPPPARTRLGASRSCRTRGTPVPCGCGGGAPPKATALRAGGATCTCCGAAPHGGAS